ncbi:porin [Ventosimonas gracilis]|uniref:Porin n=1 Tax=Ventosimonas gracilis TaxID=1680762 RepID=A0A139SUI5_9GAMM|nr:OprD family porin [Ventosimonas gracilis]KXU38194.1 porin [Ventosimonas gracilis]
MYFNRDYRSGSADRKEWGQGFELDARSGYSEGRIGFGIDAIGWFALKLDSGAGRTGTGLFPRHDDGHSANEYSRLGLTGKMKWSATELRYGSHLADIPLLVVSNTRRLMPQSYEGVTLESREWGGLSLSGGRLSKVIARDSTDAQKLRISARNRRYPAGIEADLLFFVGADYRFNEAYSGRYWYGELEDIYRQHFFGLTSRHKLGNGTLKSDWRLMVSRDSGQGKAGRVDNRAFNAMLSYTLKSGQGLSLGWQQMSGATGFAGVAGSAPYLLNFVQINDFANAGERSWQLRYDYDSAALGVPGLAFMTRYLHGDHSKTGMTRERGKEWERDIDIRYTVQQGVLKNVWLHFRNGMLRSDLANDDINENRLYIGYSYRW